MPTVKYDGIKKRCDCSKRQWPKCTHPWHFSFHHNDREYRYSLDAIARLRGQQLPRSKSEAIAWRDALRGEIRHGVDPAAGSAPTPTTPSDSRLTFGDIADKYVAGHVRSSLRRENAQHHMKWNIALLRRTEIPAAHGATVRLEAKPIGEITKADVEAVRAARRAALADSRAKLTEADALLTSAASAPTRTEARALRRKARAVRASLHCRPGAKAGEVGINRLLARLRHIFSWAIAEGYITDTPFKRGPVNVVRLESKAEGARTRRLEPGEEERLLAHAGPHLRGLIVAALSTGCRLGELLSLQWHQVRRDEKGVARWLVLTADKTKTNESRLIPVGPRLRAELEMRPRTDPAGEELPASAHVFGDELGEAIASIKTAWTATCRRAHISNLHFHDLRREFGSRLLESSADLHDVRDFLGHANITTTSRYLRSTPVRLERALAKLDPPIRTPFAQNDETAPPADTEIPPTVSDKLLVQ
jgi:integrase